MLSTYDIVYLDFKDRSAVQVGASYVVFRPQEKLYHPRSGKFLGYLMQILGTVKVNGTREPKVRAVVDKAFADMGRGDRIGPARERLLESVNLVPNTVSLQNLIVVAELNQSLTVVGAQNRVLVDAGSAQGVQVGNVFTFIRQTDPITSGVGVDPSADQDLSFPVEDIGRCLAVDVRETMTTCLTPPVASGKWSPGTGSSCGRTVPRPLESLAKIRFRTGMSPGGLLDPVGAGAYVSPPLRQVLPLLYRWPRTGRERAARWTPTRSPAPNVMRSSPSGPSPASGASAWAGCGGGPRDAGRISSTPPSVTGWTPCRRATWSGHG